MMKPRSIQRVEWMTVVYLIYFYITTLWDPSLFSRSEKIYELLNALIPFQLVWATMSLVIVFLYLASFLYGQYIALAILTNMIGGAFYAIVAVGFLFAWPNIGGGLFVLASIACFAQVGRLVSKREEESNEKHR